MTNSKQTSYQILWYLENKSSLSLLENTYAIDLTERNPRVLWNNLWILLNSWSLTPIQDDWNNVDIVNTNEELVSYIDNNDSIVWTWAKLFTWIYNWSKEYLGNKDLAKFDSSLIWYWNMETLTLSWWINYLKDFSWYWNNWECRYSNTTVSCWTSSWAQIINWEMFFDWINDYIRINYNSIFDIQKSMTFSAWITPTTIISHNNQIISKWWDAHNFRMLIWGWWLVPLMSFFWTTGQSIYVWSPILLNNKTLVTTTFDNVNDTVIIYYNWIEVRRTNWITWDIDNDYRSLWIWALFNWNEKFEWKIDDVRIYNRVLLPNEILSYYNLFK